jgi:hypothetical protein
MRDPIYGEFLGRTTTVPRPDRTTHPANIYAEEALVRVQRQWDAAERSRTEQAARLVARRQEREIAARATRVAVEAAAEERSSRA